MDILTHACIGLIAAAPVLNSHPELALAMVAGSVLPDLDALSRLFGKRAFLRSHQTWSHALPVQLLVSVVAGFAAQRLDTQGMLVATGLFAGFALHTLLDFSNTLGVTLLAPFSCRRFCTETIFFIDGLVLAITLVAAVITLGPYMRNGEMSWLCAEIYFGTLASYFTAKGVLRYRARRPAPEAISIMPSALWPWRFLAISRHQEYIQLDQINAITGTRLMLQRVNILDDTYAPLLTCLPEIALMRDLSPAYHIVNSTKTGDGIRLLCRDLRTRNFKTTFGDLEVLLDVNQNIIRTQFHV